MANSNIASIGRFSSQMLTYLGTQRTVKNVGGSVSNVFKYNTDVTAFVSPDSLQQSAYGIGVVGNYSPNVYDNVVSYFLSRGATKVYADTMTALVIDIAAVLGVAPLTLIEQSEINGRFVLSDTAYTVFNQLRDPVHQLSIVTPIDNKFSLQARSILG